MRATLTIAALMGVAWAVPAAAQPATRTPIFQTEWGGPRLRVTARAETGILPKSVNVSPDGRHVVVCNFGRLDGDTVYVYDAVTLERTGIISFDGNAVESVFTADGRTLYVSNFRRHRVEEIDFATLTVRREFAVGAHPKTVVLSPDERTLYVANYFDESVSVVDLQSGREVRRLEAGDRPRGMGVLPDGTLLTAAFRDDAIRAFGENAGGPRDEWPVCRYPRDILTAPNGQSYYLTCTLGCHIGFYHPEDRRRPFGIASTGRNPRSIAISSDGRWLAVANFGTSDVSLIDTVGRTHRQIELPGASRVVGVAIHPGDDVLRVYATSWETGELFMLSGEVPH